MTNTPPLDEYETNQGGGAGLVINPSIRQGISLRTEPIGLIFTSQGPVSPPVPPVP